LFALNNEKKQQRKAKKNKNTKVNSRKIRLKTKYKSFVLEKRIKKQQNQYQRKTKLSFPA